MFRTATDKTPSLAQSQALAFDAMCKAHGFLYSLSDTRVRIEKAFTPGDMDAFTACDMFAGDVLALVPLKGGSVWGTDGGSVGGYSALKSGQFVMNKSGEGGKRFINALRTWNKWK